MNLNDSFVPRGCVGMSVFVDMLLPRDREKGQQMSMDAGSVEAMRQ
jgi:hypothetical protein